jgi:HAMP domain-containing protein
MTPVTETSSSLTDSQSRKNARRPIDVELELGSTRMKVLRLRFDINFQAGDVENDLNPRFVALLEEVRQEFIACNLGDETELKPLPQDLFDEFMAQLRDLGEEAYALLPEGALDYIAELEHKEADRDISLDFTFPPSMALLWEMVYIINDDDPPDPEDPDGYRRFWGFRYPIGHLFWESDPVDRIKLQNGVFASVHKGLKHAQSEVEELAKTLKELRTQLNRQIDLAEMQEVLGQDDLIPENLLAHLSNEEFKFEIVHFACHCFNPTESGASQAYLCLMPDDKMNLRLGKFRVEARRKGGFRYKPLVFLNACESATPLHLLQSLNLPTSLLDFGAGGVIATACTVPDKFASAFAAEFYRRLFRCETQADQPFSSCSNSVGEALLETRWHFLREYRNPLGLAYGLYTYSNQQVQLQR